MKLLLTSAGLSNKTIIGKFSDLVGLPNDKIHIVFIPTAANVEENNKDWLISDYVNLKKQNYGCIDIVDISALPKDIWLPRIKKANVIFVGGGNTFYLMSWLKKSSLDKILPELLKTRVYVGISAGSIVATVNLRMSTSQKSYSEKVFPLINDEGLGFVNFHVRPHLNSEHFPKLRVKYIQEITKEIPEPVYAIDDDTAIVINNNKIEIVSEGNGKSLIRMGQVKIVVYVPKSHTGIVRQAMGDAGAGKLGNYSHCTYSAEGTGRYKPLEGAKPFIGQVGKFEEVEEERIECICERSIAREVIKAIKKVHPYEEIAFDIYPLISEEELRS